MHLKGSSWLIRRSQIKTRTNLEKFNGELGFQFRTAPHKTSRLEHKIKYKKLFLPNRNVNINYNVSYFLSDCTLCGMGIKEIHKRFSRYENFSLGFLFLQFSMYSNRKISLDYSNKLNRLYTSSVFVFRS